MAKKKPSLGRERDLLRIACFVLFTAMLLHETRGRARGNSSRHRCNLRAGLLEQWTNAEQHVAGGPILDLAKEILTALPDGPDANRMLLGLESAARMAARSGVLLNGDFVGRIYHELLLSTSGHHYATYYTSGSAAELLARLVFHAPSPSWDVLKNGARRDFRIVDPACGSGTLLAAAYNALCSQRALCEDGGTDPASLHAALDQSVLHGWDVLDFSTHLTLSALALQSREGTLAKQANIARMPLGIDGTRVRLGSLDYLDPESAPRDKFDVVLMNPPFSRSAKPNAKFGFGAADTQKRMNAALGAIACSRGLKKAAVAGLTPFFMQLGLDLMKEGGRIGMVVPRSTLSGVGTSGIRKRFEAQAKLAFIISNFDPGSRDEGIDGWSWSENTDLGEVLISAENAAAHEHHCTFVNVTRRPRNNSEAVALSDKVTRISGRSKGSLLSGEFEEIRIDDRSFGALYRLPQASLSGNWLKGCTFANPLLNRLSLQVLANKTMEPLHTFVEVVNREHALGRDIAAIKPNFHETTVDAGARLVLGHQADMNTLDLDPIHVIFARPKDDKARLMFERFASTFLIAERPHLLTESLLAMRAPERVVATAFWEVQAKPDCALWLLLWLNSTYGLTTYLSHATSSMADIFKMKKDQLRDLPVPAPASPGAARALYETLRRQRFAPYTEEFHLASEEKGPRFALDAFFSARLELPALTRDLYAALSCDPPISRKSIGR